VTNSIVWFRRDLRLADNQALVAAIADGRNGDGGVIPPFVLDDGLWKAAGPNRR
jgi:deoxyribodipyrimidine photo-lyase